MKSLPNIAIHGSHNASVAVEHNGEILEVLEFERLYDFKNMGYQFWDVPVTSKYTASLFLAYFKNKYGFTEYDTCLYQACEDFLQYIPAQTFIEGNHHESHANGCFYQSPFEQAIVISYDGGGNDGYFRIFLGDRKEGMTSIKDHQLNVGGAYMWLGHFLGDIKFNMVHAPMVYAGKILGLQSYGTSRPEWFPHFKEYYTQNKLGEYEHSWKILFSKIGAEGVSFGNRLIGQFEYDVAATSQAAFEEVVLEHIDDIIAEHPDLPICIAGGCALNIVFNTHLKEKYDRPVFIGPNPNDCGLAVGMLAGMVKPETPFDSTYLGPEILDKNMLFRIVEEHHAEQIPLDDLALELRNGKIIGLVQGRSEHGPRALGNRSILCNPLIPDMKERLNDRVKHREWYRPFAPVVRLEDVSEYFEWEGESRWMSFCVGVKEEYKEILPSIVHVDGSARVQTVTREQNEYLYDLLTEFKKLTGVGVLLNTSFNVDGKPILSTYQDAFTVLNTTELDSLCLEGFYFTNKDDANE